MIACAPCTLEQIQSEFLSMLPELTGRFRCRFREYGWDLASEFTAEAIAFGWAVYLSARRRGKAVTAGNISWYAARAVLTGRKLAGSSQLDPLSQTAASVRRFGRPVRLAPDVHASQGFYMIFGDRRSRWSVLDIVAAKMMLDRLLEESDVRDRLIIGKRISGDSQKEIACDLGISPAAVCLRLRGLRRRWEALSAA